MNKLESLYEGKAKILYKTDSEGILIQHFKDDATAFDGIKKGSIGGKGRANNLISSRLFRLLEKSGIKTHYIETLSDNEMSVHDVQIIPVETVVRNISTGSLCKRYGLEEGLEFQKPIVEFYYKSDELHDPLMNNDHIIAMDLANAEELEEIRILALKVNEILKGFFDSIGVILVDFKLEFGRCAEGILLADEISPDTCRFWEKETKRKMDKDRFRQDLGDVEETYEEMLTRITGANGDS